MHIPVAAPSVGGMVGDEQTLRAKKTFRWDLARGFLDGVNDSLYPTFVLLAAIRYFDAPGTIKSLLVASVFIGLLITPVTQIIAARSNRRVSWMATAWYLLSAALLCVAALQTTLVPFVVFAVLAFLLRAQIPPLVTHLYVQNYAQGTRGNRFSTIMIVMSLCSIGCGLMAGKLMDLDESNYQWLFLAGALAAAGCGFAIFQIPSIPLNRKHVGNLWSNFTLIWQHPVFGWMLFGWMLMGLSNLMTIPLRVEYLAQEAYGINATNLQISYYTVSIPIAFRLLSIKIWGMLFDRFTLIKLRIVANLVFMSSILFFFISDSWVMIAIGAALFGIGQGAGGIMWNLWVTKLAPPEKTSAYMSIHTGFTGVRGTIAPFLGYGLVYLTSTRMAAMVAVGLIGLSCLIFAYIWLRFINERI